MEQISGNAGAMINPATTSAGGQDEMNAAMMAAMEQVVAAALLPQIQQLMSATDH